MTTMTRRGLLTGASAAVLAGCSPTPDRAVLTVGLTWIPNVQFSAFYVAVRDKLFADAGLNVQLRHHGEQEDAFGALLRGQEQVVFAAADELLLARANSPSLRCFATIYQRHPGTVLVPAGSPLHEPGQLRGHSLGIPGRFGSSYLAALAALRRGGLTDSDVQLTDIGFTQVSALMADRVDAVVGFTNNEAVQLESAGFPVRALPVQDAHAPALVGHGLACAEGTLSNDDARTLAAAVAEAERRIIQDPSLGLDATAEHVPTLSDATQRTTAEKVLAATAELWQRAGQVSVDSDAEAFDRMEQFLIDVGALAAPLDGPVLA